MEGPTALLLVSGLAALGALCVAAWGFADRPSDAALAWSIALVSFFILPVHVLGWADVLTRTTVALGTAGSALACVGGTMATARGRARVRLAASSIARFVIEGFAVPWRQRSLALFGLVLVLALSLWTAWLAYLAPSSAWDGVMYHEPMVGFALQHHGFRWIGPEQMNPMLAQADGYPRATENLMLYLVALWDRRLIDLVPSILVPILLVATYVLARRFVTSRVAALGLAAGFVLLPAIILQLRSTYVDVTFAVFLASAAAFLCRRDPTPADLWMGGLSLGLLGASKITGFVVVPLVGAVGLGILIASAVRRRRPSLALHLAVAIALMLAVMAPSYARNWARHENLFWPGRVHVEALGIDWAGPLDISDMNVTPEQGVDWFFGPPIAGQQFHDTKDNGYGNVPPFLIPPLALLGLGMALWHLLRGRDRWTAIVLLALALPLIATIAISPARHWARLNLHIVLAAWLLASYFVGLARRRMLAEGVVGALVIGAAITLYWSEPAWDVDWERQQRLSRMAPIERAAQRDEVFTLLPTETARARERELGDGDLVIVATHPWVGLFWNERFSNRIEIAPAQGVRPEAWIARARRRRAEWVVVDGRSPLAHALRGDDRWQEVGPADNSGAPTVAFRSRRASGARGGAPARGHGAS